MKKIITKKARQRAISEYKDQLKQIFILISPSCSKAAKAAQKTAQNTAKSDFKTLKTIKNKGKL